MAVPARATNLVVGDTNAARDVFVHDTQSGITRRVSVSAAGAQDDRGTSDWASISGDGRYVSFYTDTALLVADDLNAASDVFRALNAPLP